MRGLLLPIALSLSLGACTTTGIGTAFSNVGTAVGVVRGVKITQNQLNGMVAAYDTTVLRPYNVYRYSDAAYTVPRRYCTTSQPFTVSSPCARYSILVKLQPILKTVEDARKNLQADVTACNTSGDQTACAGMSATIAAFNSSVSIAKSALTQFGVI